MFGSTSDTPPPSASEFGSVSAVNAKGVPSHAACSRWTARAQGIDIGRAFPPLERWARISIGLPDENARAQAVLRRLLAS